MKFLVPNDITLYVQTVFIGMAAFSIPFLWNVYQKILDAGELLDDDKVVNILSIAHLEKVKHFFKTGILYPAAIVIFIGLVVIPLLPLHCVVIAYIVFASVFLILQPEIYERIKKKTDSFKSLDSYIKRTSVNDSGLAEAFGELWKNDDVDIENKFSLKLINVIGAFIGKVKEIIENEYSKEQISMLQKYLTDFYNSIDKRPLTALLFSDLFKNVLDWHFLIWNKEVSYLGEGNEAVNTWAEYYQVMLRISSIIDKISERMLVENGMDSYYFFEQFSKHVNSHKDKVRTLTKDGKGMDYLYVDQILTHFLRIFFDKIADSPSRFNIWENYFPKDWLITDSSVKIGNPINRIIWNRFIEFAAGRIGAATKNDFDKSLNELNDELFPQVAPERWSKILIFTLSPYDPSHRIDSVVRRPWTFGLGGRIRAFSGFNEGDKKFQEDFDRYMRESDEAEKIATYKLALLLFGNQFTKANLSLYIIEAKGLSYVQGSDEDKKRDQLLRIFEEMQKSIDENVK